MTVLLEVRDLRTEFATDAGTFTAVDGVGFEVEAGHTLAIVGESGCGKSVTALSIMGLVPHPPGRVVGGSVRFEGTELIGLDKRALNDLRGNAIAMIFQEPECGPARASRARAPPPPRGRCGGAAAAPRRSARRS